MADDSDDDVKAITALTAALKPLDPETRARVLEFVLKKLGMNMPGSRLVPMRETGIELEPTPDLSPGPAPRAPAPPHRAGVQDIRSFAAEKNPKSVSERVAVVAYYLAHIAAGSDRKEYLAAEDIKPHFIQAGFALPTATPHVTLVNAKNAGYFNAADRGQYKLNAVGYNLVAHKLPNDKTGGNATTRTSPKKGNAGKKSAARKKTGK